MSTLIQRRPGGKRRWVRVVYPNLALTSRTATGAASSATVTYTESIYTLMSQLRAIRFPTGPQRARPRSTRWKQRTSPGSTSSGPRSAGPVDVGTDVGLIYADIDSEPALNALAGNLVRGLFKKSHSPGWTRPVEIALAGYVVRREVRHMAKSERGTPDVTLSPKSRLGVNAYLAGSSPPADRDRPGRGTVRHRIHLRPHPQTVRRDVAGHGLSQPSRDPQHRRLGRRHRRAGAQPGRHRRAAGRGPQRGLVAVLPADRGRKCRAGPVAATFCAWHPKPVLRGAGRIHPAGGRAVARAVTAAASDLVALHHRVQAALVQSGIK